MFPTSGWRNSGQRLGPFSKEPQTLSSGSLNALLTQWVRVRIEPSFPRTSAPQILAPHRPSSPHSESINLHLHISDTQPVCPKHCASYSCDQRRRSTTGLFRMLVPEALSLRCSIFPSATGESFRERREVLHNPFLGHFRPKPLSLGHRIYFM